MRAHDSAGSPAKKTSPVRAKKTVSAAAVFGKHKRVNHGISTPRKSKSHSNFTEEDAEAATLLSVKSHSSSRSTEKRISKKRPSDMHPLSVAFKGRVQHHPPTMPIANIPTLKTPAPTTADTSTRRHRSRSTKRLEPFFTHSTRAPYRSSPQPPTKQTPPPLPFVSLHQQNTSD